MFRAVLQPAARLAPMAATPVRGMATLKEISMRLKSVQSIQKITKSMKMVSAAKFARAERTLKASRALGPASNALAQKSEVDLSAAEKQIFIAISSDRGLCGGCHSGIAKAIKAAVEEIPATVETKLCPIGDKARGILVRTHGSDFLLSASELGKKPPTFSEAAYVAAEILNAGYDFQKATIFYNHFKSAVAYNVEQIEVPSLSLLEGKPEMDVYDDVDTDALQGYLEFTFASNMYYAMLENATSEQSARMTAMENASTNAGDMINNLQLTFNRTRQAVITRELIEIISGAAALD